MCSSYLNSHSLTEKKIVGAHEIDGICNITRIQRGIFLNEIKFICVEKLQWDSKHIHNTL